MAPSTTDAARLWRDARVAYGDDAAQALAAFARMRKSGGDFADSVVTAKIPHIPEHALAAGHGRSGEGSRGGNIVRHTASGHAVYGPSIGGRTRKTSLPVDVLRQAAARSKAKAEDRHRQMSDAEREFAEGPNTVRRPYRTLHEEVYGEPLGKARRVKPGAGQGSFDLAMKKAIRGEAETLSKGGGTVKPPPGYELVPHGNKGGYRKRTSAGYRYWYPSQGHGGNERSHAIAHHEAMREHHRAAGAAATGDARDAHATAERIHASAFARHVQGAGSKDSRRRASMQADQASGMADFGLNMATARFLTEKPHRPHAGLGEPEGVGLAKGQRVGSWVYSGTSDGPIARGIESGAIVVGTLAPMAKGWPLQAPPAQTQRLAAELEQRHDDQAGHWGSGGLAQWWKDTYAGQEHVTVPLWLQQAGLPYGTTTPAVAQRSLTPAEEALARIYQAADPRCATGLRVAEAQREGVKIVAG